MVTKGNKHRNIKPKKPVKTLPDAIIEPVGDYSLEVRCNDTVYNCTTNNIAEALGGLNIARFKTRTFITVTKGGKVFTRILNVPRAKKVLKNANATRFFAIGIERFFKF
jgi:hypothetical protein